MHVALLFPARFPTTGYGGTQRMLERLGLALAERGHAVSVLCAPGSVLPWARIVPIDVEHARATEFAIEPHIPAGADVLLSFVPVRRPPATPWVWRLAGNMKSGRRPPANTICVSADHARRHGIDSFVHNGVPPDEFRFEPAKGDYDLFLGRLHAVKGYRWAIDGAKRARRKLVIAGAWRPSFRRSLRFVGTVDGARKAELLAGARCLWMPAQWEDPCPGVLLESMMSGTPVLGTRRGSLPEIVSPDVGLLGDSVEELVSLAARIDEVDPVACRARAERWFSHRRMAAEYERMLQHFLSTGVLPAGEAPPV